MTSEVRQLVVTQGPGVLAFAFALSRHPQDAEDLAQEAYRRALCRWPRIDRHRPLDRWCKTVVRNLYLDGRRGYARTHVVSLDCPVSEYGLGFGYKVPDSSPTVLETLERRETVARVRSTLRRMRPGHRVALSLCYMQGLRYSEAARALSIPIGTLRSRLHRARVAFRRSYLISREA